MNNTWRKIDLYLISLGLLFFFFIILTANFPDGDIALNRLSAWRTFFAANPVSLISAFLLVYCIYAYKKFNFDLKGATEIPFEITKLESINYEHLTFLATYVVPLISFDFTSGRQMIVLALLLGVMGAIYLKTDLFYANPSLALLGFHIYRADGNFKSGNRQGMILICRERLIEGKRVSYIKLDDRIYYVKGVAK